MARNRKKADGGFIGSTFDDYVNRMIPKYWGGSSGVGYEDDPQPLPVLDRFNPDIINPINSISGNIPNGQSTGPIAPQGINNPYATGFRGSTDYSQTDKKDGKGWDVLSSIGSLAGAGVNLAMALKKRDTGVNQKGWDALSRMRQMNSRAMQMNNQAIANRPQRYDVGPAREEINTAYNTAGYNLRNAGASPGSYQANMGALMTGKNMATDKLLAYQQNMEDQYRIGTSDAMMRNSDAMRQSAAQEGTLGYYLSEADKQRQMGADAAGRSYWGQFDSDISNWSQMQQKMRGERGRDEELLALLKSGYYPNFNYDRPTGWGFNKQQG
jgi:hypothetical protein